MSFINDLRVAFRSLRRTRGLALTVILTLANRPSPQNGKEDLCKHYYKTCAMARECC